MVVAESLFADTPVALLEGAEVGSAAFINERTGRFLPEHDLAAGLTRSWPRPSVRTAGWAARTSPAIAARRVLNGLLRDHQLAAGGEWTRDLAPLCWRPDPQLFRPEDAAWDASRRDRIKTLYGIEIG